MKEAKLYDYGQVKLVDLYGSWEEMGRQYGTLTSPMLLHMKSYLDGFRKQSPEKDSSIQKMGRDLFRNYPHNFKTFFQGASQTSGISLEELVTLNSAEFSEGFFCSAIAMWNDYSKGNLVFGRNYDTVHYQEVVHDVMITVFHPSDGSLATAIIGFAGVLYAVNGINEKGLLVELNNGMPSAGFDCDFEMIPSTVLLMDLMLRAQDINYIDAFFKTTRSFSAFIIGVADSHEARAYEWCMQGVKRADEVQPDGLVTITNHYIHPDWPFPVPTDADSWNSLTRFSNLNSQAEAIKGRADANTVQAIMDTEIEKGGPKHDFTRYQFVFEPSTMALDFKLAESAEWAHIDLGRHLR